MYSKWLFLMIWKLNPVLKLKYLSFFIYLLMQLNFEISTTKTIEKSISLLLILMTQGRSFDSMLNVSYLVLYNPCRILLEIQLFHHDASCEYLTLKSHRNPLRAANVFESKGNWLRGTPVESTGCWEGYDQCQETALHLLSFLPWCTLLTTCQLKTKMTWR